jgi:hypothetical protein
MEEGTLWEYHIYKKIKTAAESKRETELVKKLL